MAETAAGWLTAAAGDTPARRALHLLGGFLDDEQKGQAEAAGGFSFRTADRLYWIPLRGSPRCAVVDEAVIEHLCIAPQAGDRMPEADVALTYLLWLQADPEGFRAEANVLRTESIERSLAGADLLARLAGPTAGPTAASRPRRRRPRHATARSEPDLARASALGEPLDVRTLQALLERNGRRVPPAVLQRLSELFGPPRSEIL